MPKNSLKAYEPILQSQLSRSTSSLLRPSFWMDANTKQSHATSQQ